MRSPIAQAKGGRDGAGTGDGDWLCRQEHPRQHCRARQYRHAAQRRRAGDSELRTAALTSIPMRRLGMAEDISGLVVFLASDDARYCTGGYFMADGGLLAI